MSASLYFCVCISSVVMCEPVIEHAAKFLSLHVLCDSVWIGLYTIIHCLRCFFSLFVDQTP